MTALEALMFAGSGRRSALFDVDSADHEEAGIAMVGRAVGESRPYAMCFLDMRMPTGRDGLAIIEHLGQADPRMQIVLCSARADADWGDIVGRLRNPDNLLVLRKPFEPIEVQQCASAFCSKWQNERLMRDRVANLQDTVTQRTQGWETAARVLEHVVTHDGLTGLPNRALLETHLGHAIAEAAVEHSAFPVFVCCFDRLRPIIESLGHAAGDALMRDAARRLTGAVRNIDMVARLSADEFVVVLARPTTKQDADRIAVRITDSFQHPARIDDIDLHACPTIGVAFFPEDGCSAADLLAHAGTARQVAKQRGNREAQRYSSSMELEATRARIVLEGELHRALARGQFAVHYQPQIDTRDNRICGAEALVRWHHPTLGHVSPAEFIPLAEEIGLISSIGEWVLREACTQAREWQRRSSLPLRVAVNLSAVQLRTADIVETVRRALLDAELDPRLLEIELTESAVMTDPVRAAGVLAQLSDLGVSIAIDDFGTGHSSLSHLRRLPIDTLKIDRSFMSEIPQHAEDASIVRAIIALAHTLKLNVIAEGVEGTEQLAFLKTLDCEAYQGYLYSKPVTAEAFLDLVARQPSHPLQDPIRGGTPAGETGLLQFDAVEDWRKTGTRSNSRCSCAS